MRRHRFFHTTALTVVVLLTSSTSAEESTATVQPPPLDTLSQTEFAVLKQFFEYDRRIPLEARIVEQKQEHGGVRQKIVFRSTQGFLVPGYLEYRSGTDGPRSCVLLMHGWSGSKDSWYARDNYISGSNVRESLLQQGFVTLALDAQCHGDRISQNDFAPVNHFISEGEQNPRRGYFTQREIYVQTVLDYRRALDYLATRADVDTSQIGVVGYSMGGTQSLMLTAIDNRVKATVACAVPADPKRLSPIAPHYYAAQVAGRHMLMIWGRNDEMCSQLQARQIHAMLPQPAAKPLFVDGTHRMSSEYAPHAVKWLTMNLKQPGPRNHDD